MGRGCSGERQIDVLCAGEEGCHLNPCEPRLSGQGRLTAFVGRSSLSKLCFIDSRLGGPGFHSHNSNRAIISIENFFFLSLFFFNPPCYALNDFSGGMCGIN